MITSRGSKWPILVEIGPRDFSRHIREIYTLRGIFYLFFLRFFNSGTARTAGPIFTRNTSKDVFLRKVVPIVVQNKNISSFHPKTPQNPNFGVPVMHFLWETKILIAFELLFRS